MILGIGNDLVDIRRIAALLERFGPRFESRWFTQGERALAPKSERASASYYAKRFAAREACAKALGTGMGAGAGWQEMEVARRASGQPVLRLAGRAADRLAALTPEGMQGIVHLSLSDEYPMALATVVLEAVKTE